MHNILNHKGMYSLVPRSLGIWGIQYSISKYSCSPSEVYREHWMICTLIIKYWLLSTTQYMQYAFFSSIHVIITVTSCLVPQSTLSWSIFFLQMPHFYSFYLMFHTWLWIYNTAFTVKLMSDKSRGLYAHM